MAVSTEVAQWLLDGDVAVQYQTTRDLLRQDASDLQARIATEGYGAALLSARGPERHWGRGFYLPKWTSSHYTLLELRNLGLAPDNPLAQDTVDLILTTQKGRDGGVGSPQAKRTDACVNGMTLNYASYFGADQEQLASIVDFLLDARMGDGGFNCRFNGTGATHSSMHTTVSVLEGITSYRRAGYAYGTEELTEAARTSMDFLLLHHLYRSERTGETIDERFTQLHHPPRWHFDILRGLDAMVDAGLPYDPRMGDALEILRGLRRRDGTWPCHGSYTGATHLPRSAAQPTRWVTLGAARVLNAVDPRGSRPARPPLG
jgi:hypothetical protein